MRFSLLVPVTLSLLALSFVLLVPHTVAAPTVPLVPDTMGDASAAASSSAPSASAVSSSAAAVPVRLRIPSIGLSSTVESLGINDKGEMDVPDGSTTDVGWYEYGTTPGEKGSAVMDAHVFAAFSSLSKLKDGADVYVDMSDGTELHFIVQERDTYALADVPLQTLFNRADEPRLNLITCAGKLTADRSTYDHRLVVYAVLAQ